MDVSLHPPLCPKVPNFWSLNERAHIWSQIGYSTVPEVRKFIARYQACAWQDRAARWGRVWCRGSAKNDQKKNPLCLVKLMHRLVRKGIDEQKRCNATAVAWRDWERDAFRSGGS